METSITPQERLHLQRRSKWIVGIAVISLMAVNIMSTGDVSVAWAVLMWVAWLAFIALFIWGCADMARSKGYPWQYGVLGLISIVGYLIVLCLPDKWLADKYRPTTAKVEESNYTRDPNRL
jgi:hypothetical protein